MNQPSLSSFIWSVADLLRGDYKQSEYVDILPFTVLRRLDCVLQPTKAAILAEHNAKLNMGLNPEPFLLRKAGQSFYNTSPLDLKKLMGDQDHIKGLYPGLFGSGAGVQEGSMKLCGQKQVSEHVIVAPTPARAHRMDDCS
nr:type I restriction-modification system subunit M N-terminal domain-containing protein [Anthocerotibacter panamensis]